MSDRDFILTGTQVYGVATKNSDIDIVLKRADAEALEEELELKNIRVFRTEVQKHNEYSGFYFQLGIMNFNIVCVKDDTYLAKWRHATESMRGIPPIPDREERIKAFHNFFCKGGSQ